MFKKKKNKSILETFGYKPECEKCKNFLLDDNTLKCGICKLIDEEVRWSGWCKRFKPNWELLLSKLNKRNQERILKKKYDDIGYKNRGKYSND